MGRIYNVEDCETITPDSLWDTFSEKPNRPKWIRNEWVEQASAYAVMLVSYLSRMGLREIFCYASTLDPEDYDDEDNGLFVHLGTTLDDGVFLDFEFPLTEERPTWMVSGFPRPSGRENPFHIWGDFNGPHGALPRKLKRAVRRAWLFFDTF